MAKWIKGTKTIDLNVKINMDAWRQRLDVSPNKFKQTLLQSE